MKKVSRWRISACIRNVMPKAKKKDRFTISKKELITIIKEIIECCLEE